MKTSEMPVFTLSGNPYNRGRDYGAAAKELIAQIINAWQEELGGCFDSSTKEQGLDTQSYLQAFLQETAYLSAIKQWAPDLLEEVKGIAAGSDQSIEKILGLQLMDEEWVYGMQRALQRPTEKCTAFGAPDSVSGVSYAGQNMDVGKWVEGQQVLLRVAATEHTPEALVFTIAGGAGFVGINAKGLGITCNTLTQLNSSSSGLPVTFVVRKVLEQHSIDEAEIFLKRIKHASGQNYILSSFGDIRCLECCATSVASYKPQDHRGRVFHTNHPLENRDINKSLLVNQRRSFNTVARLKSITERLGSSENIYLPQIKAALSAHDDPDNPVSRNEDNEGSSIGYTAGSVIYEYGKRPRLHLASGPPCITEYKVFDFNEAG